MVVEAEAVQRGDAQRLANLQLSHQDLVCARRVRVEQDDKTEGERVAEGRQQAGGRGGSHRKAHEPIEGPSLVYHTDEVVERLHPSLVLHRLLVLAGAQIVLFKHPLPAGGHPAGSLVRHLMRRLWYVEAREALRGGHDGAELVVPEALWLAVAAVQG